LERGKLVTGAVLWKAPLEGGEGHSPQALLKKKKKMAIAKGG
jgi:hypothetical protein